MRIVVNDIAASEGGALSVLKEFHNEILSSEDNNEWIFFLNDNYIPNSRNIEVKTFHNIKKSWYKRLVFDFISGRKIINKLHPDIYISLQNTATIGVNCEQLVYLHQSLPYQTEKNFSFFKKKERKLAVYQKIIGRVFNCLFKKTNSDIIVQSNWMKNNLSKKVNNKIFVIPPSIKYPVKTEFKNNYNFDEICRTFFYPASDFVYKNHTVIFDAVEKLHSRGFKHFKVILTLEKKNVKHQNLYKFLGNISREQVFDFYSKSTLLFPSYIETYGLPLQEAQMFGHPIIAADTKFSNEVLKNYNNKFFFDRNDSDKLADIMAQILNNDLSIGIKPQTFRPKKKLLDFLNQEYLL